MHKHAPCLAQRDGGWNPPSRHGSANFLKAYANQALQEGDHVCWAEVRVARIGSVESRAQAKGAIMPVLQGKWKDKT
jgi:hypothetical protein